MSAAWLTAAAHVLSSHAQGPVDVSKAKRLMGWESTPWREVVREAVPFYEAAMRDPRFERERDQALSMVYEEVERHGKQRELPDALFRVYGVRSGRIEELRAAGREEARAEL